MDCKIICVSEIENVEIDGVVLSDHPDFADAYVTSACWRSTGLQLTEEELDRIDPDAASCIALMRVSEGDHL